MNIIPNLHPILVHFSITLIVLMGLLQLIQWFLKTTAENLTMIAVQKWLTLLGSVAVILTVATGLYAAATVNHDTASHLAMMDHRNWALPTAVIFLLGCALFYFLPKLRQSVAGSLFVISLLLVTVTAFKGGELVYRHGLGVLSLPEVTGDGHDHEHGNGHDNGEENIIETQSHDTLDAPLNNDAAKTVLAFHSALTSGNAEQARKLLMDGVIIFEGGGVERSADEYANHHLKSDIAFMSKMKVTLLEHQVEGNGDMAVSMARSKIQGRYKDKDIDLETMETMVLKKHDGNWRIMHIHWSN